MFEKQIDDEESIHRLYHLVHKEMIRFIKEELKPHHFNRGEFPLLLKLIKEGDGVTQKEIRGMLPISKSTISKSVKSLCDKGYLKKEKDEEDRRATRVYLTEKGKEMEDIIGEIDRKAEEQMLKGFDESEAEEFKTHIKKIHENLVEGE